MRAVVFVLIYLLLQTVAGLYSRNINKNFITSKSNTLAFVGDELSLHLCNFTINESTKLDAPISLVKYDHDYFNFSNPINLYDTVESGYVYEKKVETPIRDDKIYLYDYRIDNVEKNNAGLYACAYKLRIFDEDKLIKKISHLQVSNLIVKKVCYEN